MTSDTGAATPLSEIVELKRGTTYKSALLGEPGPVLLGLASIARDGGFRRDALRTYGGESPASITLCPGDLFVSLKDVTQAGDLLGSGARLPADVPSGRLTQDTVRLLFKADVSMEYVYWILRTPEYREYCRAHATGTTTLALPRDDFLSFRLPEATPARMRIVELLQHIEQKVELEERKRNHLDTALRVQGLHLVRNGSSDWPLEPLRKHFATARGLSYTGAGLAANDSEGAIPLHNLNSILEGGGYKSHGLKYYTGAYKERHVVRPGDLVVANTEQGFEELLIGYPAIIPETFGEGGLYSHHLHCVRPKPESPLSRYWLYVWLLDKPNHDVVAGYANGTTVNMLPVSALEDPVIPIPPAERVQQLDAVVAPLLAAIEQSVRESGRLVALRDGLLPKLMSGHLPGTRDRVSADAIMMA